MLSLLSCWKKMRVESRGLQQQRVSLEMIDNDDNYVTYDNWTQYSY